MAKKRKRQREPEELEEPAPLESKELSEKDKALLRRLQGWRHARAVGRKKEKLKGLPARAFDRVLRREEQHTLFPDIAEEMPRPGK